MKPLFTRSPSRHAPGPLATTAALLFAAGAGLLISRAEEPKNPTANTASNTMSAPSSDSPTKPSAEELRKRLTPEQFRVTQQEGTEPPFRNAYWNNHAPGIYVDVVSGEALFSSLDKFESGTGWPSFTKPLAKENVVEKTDRQFGMARTEVRSKASDSHLGHVFDDGPQDQGGMRYCMNSASLRFVPVDKLEAEGLGKYKALFEGKK